MNSFSLLNPNSIPLILVHHKQLAFQIRFVLISKGFEGDVE